MFTIPGKLPVLAEAFKRFEPSYTIESDFIDDPKRPGVSSYPWQIIENQRKLLDEGLISEEYLYKLNVDNIAKAYNVTPP
jgi:TatD-related deoxyribonuclease